MASRALESAHLHAELRENYLATVRSLVLSLDARDNYAATHGQRVAGLALRMAEHMGLPESAIRDIEVFAPLHDVGKIGIRDDVLMKRGPLTEQEREACRMHCLIGDRIIRPLKPGRDALSLIRSHHESWDGRGYPDGLAGEAIPLLARIARVADCYDALVSERPHGAVMSEQEALAHFQMQAGIQYDPAIVEVLASVFQENEPEAAGSAVPEAAAVAAAGSA
jgi:HD-GYP domain-containing protein (c-di-GMP phosphodiesterase class II)